MPPASRRWFERLTIHHEARKWRESNRNIRLAAFGNPAFRRETDVGFAAPLGVRLRNQLETALVVFLRLAKPLVLLHGDYNHCWLPPPGYPLGFSGPALKRFLASCKVHSDIFNSGWLWQHSR